MKTAEQFWIVISNYNQATWHIQICFIVFIILAVILAMRTRLVFLPKVILSLSCLYTGVIFFFIFDQSVTAFLFAGPLFIATGFLFSYDALRHKEIEFKKFTPGSITMLVMCILYPAVSFLLGHRYPAQVLYILPCPLISIGIVIYSRYKTRLFFLQILMIIWAVTGLPKAFIFDVMEDLILFMAGMYGICVMIGDRKREA